MSNITILRDFLHYNFEQTFKVKRGLADVEYVIREKAFMDEVDRQNIDVEGMKSSAVLELGQRIWDRYEYSWVVPNKLVGILAAHALGEGQTQANLDSKRLTGVSKGKTKTDAFSVINRLVGFSEVKFPNDIIYFKSGTDYKDIFTMLYQIEETKLADITISSGINDTEDSAWRDTFGKIWDQKNTSVLHYRIELDHNKMKERSILVSDVVDEINDPRFTLYYTQKEGIIEIHSNKKSAAEEFLISELSPLTALHSTHIKGISKIKTVHPERNQLIHIVKEITKEDGLVITLNNEMMYDKMIYPEDVLNYFNLRYGARLEGDKIIVDSDLSVVDFKKDMNSFYVNKSEITDEMRERLLIRSEDEGGELVPLVKLYQASLLWYFEAEGSNIFELLKLDIIDRKRTYCDDPNWMLKYHGVEAVREYYIRKLLQTISFSISTANIKLLADVALSREVVKATRHGHSSQETGFLDKISFEEKMKNINNSAVAGQIDRLNTNYSTVITSKLHDIGSNSVELHPIN